MKKQQIEINLGSIYKEKNKGYCVSTENLAAVFDGCASEEHSEVGAKRMGEAIRKNSRTITSKEELRKTISDVFFDILSKGLHENEFRDKYLFTVMVCVEKDDSYEVYNAGDGFIITIDNSDRIRYIKINNNILIENGNAPQYIAYNYMFETLYIDHVFLENRPFKKTDYKSVYVATNGLSYIMSDKFPKKEREMYEKALIDGNQQLIEKIIKRNAFQIYDDIAIAM